MQFVPNFLLLFQFTSAPVEARFRQRVRTHKQGHWNW